MPNTYFKFKKFVIYQDQCAMKVGTEACILGAWATRLAPTRILDIGTGTGLLALMLAQRYECPIDAVEIDPEAAKQAKENVSGSPWASRIEVYQSSIQDFADVRTFRYDLIVCNPPFFADHQKAQERKVNVALHETEHFDKIILAKVLKRLLSKNGKAYVIYPWYDSKSFAEALKNVNLYCSNDLLIYNRPFDDQCFRSIAVVSMNKIVGQEKRLNIREEESYSDEFVDLLEDYYLDKALGV